MKGLRIHIAVMGAMLLLAGQAMAAENAGNVVTLRGKAALERGERTSALKVRAELQKDDLVKTRERSRLKMLFRNDSILTLGSSSKLVIKEYLYDAGARRAESVFELADGKMRAIVGTGVFKVLTPTAYAAARGTLFAIWYDAATNTTGIAVIEGGVEIRNIRHSAERGIILTAGQMSLITGNDGPSPPEPFSLDLWSSGAAGSHWQEILQELADLGDTGNEETIEPVDPDGLDLPPGGGGEGQPGGPEGPGGGDLPPVIEPPIDQQPTPPPVSVPIAVNPLFP